MKPSDEQINGVQKMSKVELNVKLRHVFDYESITNNCKLNLKLVFFERKRNEKKISVHFRVKINLFKVFVFVFSVLSHGFRMCPDDPG